jgi:hypothetical protein
MMSYFAPSYGFPPPYQVPFPGIGGIPNIQMHGTFGQPNVLGTVAPIPIPETLQHDGTGVLGSGKAPKEPAPHIIAWFDELEQAGRGRYMNLRDKYSTLLMENGYFTMDQLSHLTVDYLITKIGMKDGEAESVLRWAKQDLNTKYM